MVHGKGPTARWLLHRADRDCQGLTGTALSPSNGLPSSLPRVGMRKEEGQVQATLRTKWLTLCGVWTIRQHSWHWQLAMACTRPAVARLVPYHAGDCCPAVVQMKCKDRLASQKRGVDRGEMRAPRVEAWPVF